MLLAQLLDGLTLLVLLALEVAESVAALGERACGLVAERRRGPAVTGPVQGDEIGIVGEHRGNVRGDHPLNHGLGILRAEVALVDWLTERRTVGVEHAVDGARPHPDAGPKLAQLRGEPEHAGVAALDVELLERRLDQLGVVE